MTNDASTNPTNKPNGSDATEHDLITTAQSIGASAGAAAAGASDLAHGSGIWTKISMPPARQRISLAKKVVIVKDKIKELSDVDFAELAEERQVLCAPQSRTGDLDFRRCRFVAGS